MAVKKFRKYAQVINPQGNPNTAKHNDWKNIHNAVGNTKSVATSYYSRKTNTTKGKDGKTKTSYTFNYPETITAHRFGITDNDLPKNARLKTLRFGIRIKSADMGIHLTFPQAVFMIRDNAGNVTYYECPTGWGGSVWRVNSDKKLTYKDYSTATYEMSGTEFYKAGYNLNHLKQDIFGADFWFGQSQTFNTNIYLMHIWVEVEYEVPSYAITTNVEGTESRPWQLKSGDTHTLKYTVTQSTKGVKDSAQYLYIRIPFGVEIVSTSASTSSVNIIGELTRHTDILYRWKLKFDTNGSATISLKFIDYTVNKQVFLCSNLTALEPNATVSPTPIPTKNIWINTVRGRVDGYGKTTIGLMPPYHKRHLACFTVDTMLQSDDNTVTYRIENCTIEHDGDESSVQYSTEFFDFVNVDIDTEATDSGIYITDISSNSQDHTQIKHIDITFHVPSDEQLFLGFTFCLYPYSDGEHSFAVTNLDMGDTPDTTVYQDYDIADSYVYHIGSTENEDEENNEHHTKLVTERISFRNHRIASKLETGAFILPCRVKEGDSIMTQSKPSIRMYKWERIDYIGCVPLEHLHFDPKSTYKDKLLDSHYKNKRYLGKELASDEDITLNVRVHPQQVTTLQGLIDMDKPIPINANHRCFEGDALNHRGWAEIYSIKAEKTNPHWYKCDIDVKYLTHNLNTRFHIKRGSKTFGKYTLPALLTTVSDSGEKLSSNNQDDDFFKVDTDGTYTYVDDENEWKDYLDYQGNPVKWIGGSWSSANPPVYSGTILTVQDEDTDELTSYKAVASPDDNSNEILEYLHSMNETVKPFVMNENIQTYEGYNIDDSLRNRFTLDEGQHISIKTREPLSTVNQVEISWGSSKLSENKENAISRITRLIDADTDDVVFEYEYCDFDFSDFETYDNPVSGEDTAILRCHVIGRLKDDADYEAVIDDYIDLQTDVETSEETYQDGEGETVSELKYFGSKLIFSLNNSHLKIVDEGYTGREIEREVDLEGKKYYWETYWVNKNTDGEDNDIIAYFDVVAQNSVLTSQYADMYGSMYVSPFPVNGKEIIFTRDGEEGVIFYLKEDKNEFSYLIDPYYTYHNGVDLRASYENGSAISIFNLNYGYKVVYLQNGLVSLGINRLNGRMYLGRYDPISKQYIHMFNLHLNKFNDVNINSISDDRIELQASDTVIIMYRGHPYVIFRHPTEDIGIDTKSYQVYGQSVDGVTSDYPIYFDLMNHDNLLTECTTKKLDDDCVNVSEHEIDDLTDVTITLARADDDNVYEGDDVTFTVKDSDNETFTERTCYLIKKDTDTGFDEVGCNSDGSFTYTMSKSGAYQVIAVYVGDDTHSYSISNEVVVQVGEPVQTSPPSPAPPSPPLTGDYVLKMSCDSTMYYLGGEKVTFTLTKGNQPVPNKTIEMIDFNSINSAQTDPNGKTSFINKKANTHPKKYKIGGKFWDGGNKPLKSVYKNVTVKKTTPVFSLNHGAVNKGGYLSIHLKNNKGTKLANRKVQVTIDGKKYDRKTNSNGNVNIKINEKGTHKYTAVFNGDTDYNSCKATYREKVK